MANLNVISWFDKSTVKHLRFPFSFHLMPVFLFALSQAQIIDWPKAITAFFILHLLIYPASNGYNSYQDKDETSIGGLKHPPRVSRNLYYASLFLDVCGVMLALTVSLWFSLFTLLYVMISRAYSYRGLRLKKNAVTGFITVFLFQGAFTFLMSASAFSVFDPAHFFSWGNILCMSIASLFIGSVYPLTQIYQHDADKKDGVITISYLLGYTGTFIFSGLLFGIAALLLCYYFNEKDEWIPLFLFFGLMAPVVIRLLSWFMKVRKNKTEADFEHTMAMNLLASGCMNIYFLTLILNKGFHWF